jgi:hypothetical protein
MIGDVSFTRVILAGILGAVSMAIATMLFNAVRIPVVDFGRMLATKILRYHSYGTRLGLVLHILNGILLAFVYAILIEPRLELFIPLYWVRGILYGVALWLALMMVVLPIVGDGFFGGRGRRGMIGSALVVHLIYGLILGLAFKD